MGSLMLWASVALPAIADIARDAIVPLIEIAPQPDLAIVTPPTPAGRGTKAQAPRLPVLRLSYGFGW